MVKSMTGFGRGEYSDNCRKITVEMKSVNHRYLDLSIKLPKKLTRFEGGLREVLKKYAQRGKIDIYVTYESLNEESGALKYNSVMAKEYFSALKQMSEELGIDFDIRTLALARFPEIFSIEEAEFDEDAAWDGLLTAFETACRQFVKTREEEGSKLKKDLLDKLDIMEKDVARIEERAPIIVEEYRKKLTDKIKELIGDASLDESRIITEVTIFADKVAVDEEVTRLKAHIAAVRDCLNSEESVGRKLDFLAQELNREANTTLSKANDLTLSEVAIEVKTVIEKIREQIQNLE